MGLADWFNDFCSNIAIKNSGVISSRYKLITKRLNLEYWESSSETLNSLYVGSYGRGTAIDGFSDLDMIFQLPSEMYYRYNGHIGNGQSSLLYNVKRAIEKTYPTTSIRADGQVILVPFNDGIIFEVVPAFINEAGGFIFADANNGGRWRTTNPKPEIQAINVGNLTSNNNLKALCKMMRVWKDKWNVPIGGLLIDTLAYKFMEGWDNKDKSFLYYDFMSRDFFEWMSKQDLRQDYWKAPGSGQYVYRKGMFEYKAKRCYNLSLDAIASEYAKNYWKSKQYWREIYGTKFPC